MNGLRTAKSLANDGSGRGRCARVRVARVLTGVAAARKKLFICRLTCLPQVCHGKRHGFERMQLTRGDTTQHCHRLAPQDRRPRRRPEGPRSGWLIPPIRYRRVLPPPHFWNRETEKQLTAPADRSVRESAHAVAFTTAVAIGGTGLSDRRAAVASAVTCTGCRDCPGSPPATDSRHDPPLALPAIQTRCFADHHPMVAHHPAWPYHGVTVPTLSIAETCRKWRCEMILKEPHARAA